MCRTHPKRLYFHLHVHALTQKRQGIKTSHAMLAALLTTSQFPRIHFDVWIMEASRLQNHTHTRFQGHRVYPTVGKWSVIENSWTPAGRNGERKTPWKVFVQLSLNKTVLTSAACLTQSVCYRKQMQQLILGIGVKLSESLDQIWERVMWN